MLKKSLLYVGKNIYVCLELSEKLHNTEYELYAKLTHSVMGELTVWLKKYVYGIYYEPVFHQVASELYVWNTGSM
jgi:hypothetical protein